MGESMKMRILSKILLVIFVFPFFGCQKSSITNSNKYGYLPGISFLGFDPIYPANYSPGDTVYVHVTAICGETGMKAIFVSEILGDYETMDITNTKYENFPPIYDYGIYTTFDALIAARPSKMTFRNNGILEVSPWLDKIKVIVLGEKYGKSSKTIEIIP